MNNTEEYPMLVDPDWSAKRNIWTLEAIKDKDTYVYNFNELPEEMQNEIIQKYAHNFTIYITDKNINKHRPNP